MQFTAGARLLIASLVAACVLSGCWARGRPLGDIPADRHTRQPPSSCGNRVWSLSAGLDHTVVAKANGTVWGWGLNFAGDVGDGTTTHRSTPVQVKGPGGVGTLNQIVVVAAGSNHSLAVAGNGTVWAWGYNGAGSLGDGTVVNRSTPVQVLGPGGVGVLLNVMTVAGARNHSLALKSDGTVWAWGLNFWGTLGGGSTVPSFSTWPVQVRGPGGAGMLTGIVAIAGGHDHSLA
jgi:alpha-tubulin suppressor-like RCC1 family protein